MRGALTHLQKTVLHPIAAILFPEQTRGGFTGHHSFMVQYRPDEDRGLDMHTDDSDVTVNICLGRNFTGAALTVCGDSRTPRHRHFHHAYEHVRGRALVHLGSRRHGADDIRSGERNNLIVWNSNERCAPPPAPAPTARACAKRAPPPPRRYRASAEHVNRQPYEREEGPPDPRCLSYTHDRDFGEFLPYPPGREDFRGQGWCPPSFACYDSMDRVLKEEL